MKENKNEKLKLEEQICFPLYAASKEIIRKYKPFLDELDLTYTQYITMMVLWERKCQSVKQLGKTLYLDSGTLTPVLKKLENKGYVVRQRNEADERSLIVTITEQGEALHSLASKVPEKVAGGVRMSAEEAAQLHKLLGRLLDGIAEE